MRKSAAIIALGSLLLFSILGSASTAPSISFSGDNKSSYPNGQIPLYEKYEASFTISGVGTAGTDFNPFNPNISGSAGGNWKARGITVDAIITRPDGSTVRWPCFWDYSNWKFRFAPTQLGTWSYKIWVKHSSGEAQINAASFTACANTHPKRKRGFLTVDPKDYRFFSFSNGEPFYPAGAMVSSDADIASLGSNGGNWNRVFRASYMLEQWTGNSDKVNVFPQSRAQYWDNFFNKCQQNGIYVLWLCNDWTRWKSSSENPYLAEGVASSLDDSFNGAQTREVFKRKLRWMMARYGYNTSLMGFDLINEVQYNSQNFTKDMGAFIQGVASNQPSSWPSVCNWQAQPKLVTGDETSTVYRTNEVPWDSPYCGMTNYHDYARERLTWDIPTSPNKIEKMGSALDKPWKDAAVWANRMLRVHEKNGWKKPFSWTEYALIGSSWEDWTAAYKQDTKGQHIKDWIWGLTFSGGSGCYWHTQYLQGNYNSAKWHVFKGLANFLEGVDMRGLTQTTAYPVSDSLRPNPGITCSNDKIMAVGFHGSTKAYIYVKNLTNTWYYASGFRSSVPTPSNQSGTVTIKGLQPGTYTVEKWGTWDTDPKVQKKSTSTVTVGSGGTLSLSVSVGASTDYDWGYKIYKDGGTTPTPDPDPDPVVNQPNISLTLTADKTTALPGDTVTYTITYKNTGPGAASGIVISVPVPANTTYVSGSGGTLSSGKVSWTVSTCAAGSTGTVSFKVKIN